MKTVQDFKTYPEYRAYLRMHISIAALQGFLASGLAGQDPEYKAKYCIQCADELIKQLLES
jgi:hypothetical protein